MYPREFYLVWIFEYMTDSLFTGSLSAHFTDVKFTQMQYWGIHILNFFAVNWHKGVKDNPICF